MKLLNIGIDSWIIQDGNYDDFVVGQETKFALEFYPISIKPSDCKSVSAIELNANQYKICGQIIYCTERVWVLDFGFLAFQETAPPKFARKGSWIEGEIYLSIDPFFYFEYLKKLPNMPFLTYDFRVEQIFLETTPWIENYDVTSGKKIITRDARLESFQEVLRTNAWYDDNQHGSYILKCLPVDKSI